MPRISITNDLLSIGRFFSVSFQRTLRIPDDGRTWPLPPGFGGFPLRRVRDFSKRVPAAWRDKGGLFLPMHQCEALWLSFEGPDFHPSALKVGVGGINALSGAAWDEKLRVKPQDYMVTPDQPWLDGINAGQGFIRQFVAAPLGAGLTVEGQLTGSEEVGGLQFAVFNARPGRFPDREPRRAFGRGMNYICESAPGMGFGAGGRMEQKIYPDSYGMRTWESSPAASVHVHIATTGMWRFITGEASPPSPISPDTYNQSGLPWFHLYDEHVGDIAPSRALAQVRSVTSMGGAVA